MKLCLTTLLLIFLLSCKRGSQDAQPYIVVRINEDSIGSDGFKYRTILVKKSLLEYYKFSGRDNLKIGDTVLVGRNESGDFIVSGSNPLNILRPVPPNEIDLPGNEQPN